MIGFFHRRRRAALVALFAWALLCARASADPGDFGGTDAASTMVDSERLWAFQPLSLPAVPRVANAGGAMDAIDRFLLARLETFGLSPAAPADRATLLRRVTFDLIGLPPTPEQIEAFMQDARPGALRRVVDRLLASPHFGERWGRHWLDVARFAESSGGGRSLMFPHAWRYRDYVIDAIDRDQPFDEFVIEQLAGDLLAFDNQAQRDRQLIATGFLLLGPINYELQDKQLLKMEVVDEQIDTVGRAFLAMTLGCARCHDHKFDPIPMTDYYGLAGFFTSTQSLTPGNVSGYVKMPLQHGQQAEHYRAHLESVERLNELCQQATEELDKLQALAANRRAGVVQRENLDRQLAQAGQLVEQLQKQIGQLKNQAPKRPMAMAVQEAAQPTDAHLLLRGQIRQPGPVVPRCFLTAASSEPSQQAGKPEIPPGRSGRIELAKWIASPDNPLTARVIVNRVWHHLFGAGLVRTTDNFGVTGEPPSHPQLLDYLTLEFIDDGWSIKKLVRRIVLTRAYQMRTHASAAARAKDPENRLLSHANRRRLDAESLRDALLAICGRLDTARGGLTIRKLSNYDQGYEFDTNRRSVYVPRFRNSELELFSAFDVANSNVVSGRRNVSILPTQALFFMNSPFLAEVAQQTAQRVLTETGPGDQRRIEALFVRALGRPPRVHEAQVLRAYLDELRANQPTKELETYSGLCRLVFASLDFRYLN